MVCRISGNEIQANTEAGILYGVFELLRCQQTGQSVRTEIYNPSYNRRILNHWDNLNGTIERGYAGLSIFWRKGENALTITRAGKSFVAGICPSQCFHRNQRFGFKQCKCLKANSDCRISNSCKGNCRCFATIRYKNLFVG